MKIEIIQVVEVDSVYQAEEIAKIFKILIDKGGLVGVKGGSTNIHFDGNGKFMGIQFDYWPYKERVEN